MAQKTVATATVVPQKVFPRKAVLEHTEKSGFSSSVLTWSFPHHEVAQYDPAHRH